MSDSRTVDQLLVANLVCLALAFTLHLAGVGSVLLNIVKEAMDPHGMFAPSAISPFDRGEVVGRALGFALAGMYSLAGLVVIPIAGYGLYRRTSWGRKLAIAYYATATVTACCTLFGVFGLATLLRRDVRDACSR